MTDQEMAEIYQLLGGYWHDREEDDAAIVAEFVGETSPQVLAKYVDLLRRFIDSPMPAEKKAEFIQGAVWRWFTPEDVNAPIAWLKTILSRLEQSSVTG